MSYHPFFCYLGVALTFTLTFGIFAYSPLDASRFFYVPICVLIVWYTLLSILNDRQVYQPRTVKQALPKSIGKYFFWMSLLAAILWFYHIHPAYRAVTPNTRVFFSDFFALFILCGLPYLYLTEKYRYCTEHILADPFLKTALLLRCLRKFDFQRLRRRLCSKRSRGVILSGILRLHYIPIMVEQVHYGITILNGKESLSRYSLTSVMLMVTALAWLIDSNNASIGYLWQSAFTKTRFRHIDPHPTHWIIVLACYPPFIYFINSYFAMFPSLPDHYIRVFSNPSVNTSVDIAMLIALVLYMLSGCTLGFSYSNLAYKQIQTRGPYRFMRHPATTFKLIFFTLAFYRYAAAWTPGWFAFYVVWVGIYVGRALVEERFLRRFPDYRAYMQQTRYRFIPGLI